MDNERTVSYDITRGVPLLMDHEYAHCNTIVKFSGFTRRVEGSAIYFLLGAPIKLMIPLTDEMTVLITQAYTKRSGKIHGQLLECKLAENSEDTYEYERYSNIFDVIITPSLAAASMVEVTDPRLELLYTRMYEKFLEISSYDYTHDAEAWAVGTRKGVPTTDETYHNNAKYWSDLAQQAADERGFAWFEVNEEDGEVYVTVTPNLDEEVQFEVNTTSGELEVVIS